ncbi:MAG TPA: NAD-dependent epimerase/dehydratase family protein [Bacteroidia bacterium]|nr:NAD-dependent epimerase/dehydratase family protein [Bacteroidia bacterium]
MKVLLTGASGYIGSALLNQLLSRRIQVTAVTRNSDVIPAHPLIKIVEADLTHEDAVDTNLWGCDHVIHAAGLARAWVRDKHRYFEENCNLTSTLLKASLRSGVRKFVFISSAGVLKASDGAGSEETAVLTAITNNAYTDSKLLSELIALQFQSAGLPVIIVRPARVYGPGKLSASNQVTQTIINYINGRPLVIPGKGTHTGSYCLVQDVARGVIDALMIPGLTGIYNFGGTNASYNELFETIGNEWGRIRRLTHIQKPVLITAGLLNQFGGWVTNGSPLLTLNQVKKLTSNHSVNSSKAVQHIGYSFTPLSTGIKETIMWAQQNGFVTNGAPYSFVS